MPLFRAFKERFYLAGEMSLALQIGHRDGVDFDFFTSKNIDTKELFEELREVFIDHKIVKIQEEQNTLSVIIDDAIKVSFYTYPYTLIQDTIHDEHMTLASIEDIACMKLSAITGRASNKDYVDLYFILELFSLQDLLEFTYRKHPELDRNLILKSLVYFDDITEEKILFKNNKDVPFENVKKRLQAEVKKTVNI